MFEALTGIAGITLRLRTRYREALRYFPKALTGEAEAACPAVRIPDQDWEEYLSSGWADSPHTEYSMLTPYISDALMEYDRVVMHGVALRFRERAYLIIAHSGVGKSTQARFLQELLPGEITVICGDRPVLEMPKDESAEGCVIVHPSPWNGKENWHGAPAAPLAGLILLERGAENKLTALNPREAVLTTYPHFIQTYWDPEKVKKSASMETRLLTAVPIWKLTSFQVPDSTKLLEAAVFGRSE